MAFISLCSSSVQDFAHHHQMWNSLQTALIEAQFFSVGKIAIEIGPFYERNCQYWVLESWIYPCSYRYSVVYPSKILRVELLICNGISYMQSVTAFGPMQSFLAVLTSSPVLLEVISATVKATVHMPLSCWHFIAGTCRQKQTHCQKVFSVWTLQKVAVKVSVKVAQFSTSVTLFSDIFSEVANCLQVCVQHLAGVCDKMSARKWHVYGRLYACIGERNNYTIST